MNKGFNTSRTEELKLFVLKIYDMCASPAKQSLKRHWFNELQSQKTECQHFCPFPQPFSGADRTHFPPREGAGRCSSCFDSAPCPALHMDQTLPCLSFPPRVFHWMNSSNLVVKSPLSICPHCILYIFSTRMSLHHPGWAWVFPPRSSSWWQWWWAREKASVLHWGGTGEDTAEKKKNQERQRESTKETE